MLSPPCALRRNVLKRAEWSGLSWLRCTSLAWISRRYLQLSDRRDPQQEPHELPRRDSAHPSVDRLQRKEHRLVSAKLVHRPLQYARRYRWRETFPANSVSFHHYLVQTQRCKRGRRHERPSQRQ